MHCGWMPSTEWREPRLGVPQDFDVDVCPGWLVKQPAVIDGARAWRARDQKALEYFDPERLAVTWEMTEIADAAIALYQSEKTKKR